MAPFHSSAYVSAMAEPQKYDLRLISGKVPESKRARAAQQIVRGFVERLRCQSQGECASLSETFLVPGMSDIPHGGVGRSCASFRIRPL